MARTNGKYKMWTKAELAMVLELWSTLSLKELSEKLGVKPAQLLYVTRLFRKNGYSLPRKHFNGSASNLINEVLKEKGLIK